MAIYSLCNYHYSFRHPNCIRVQLFDDKQILFSAIDINRQSGTISFFLLNVKRKCQEILISNSNSSLQTRNEYGNSVLNLHLLIICA